MNKVAGGALVVLIALILIAGIGFVVITGSGRNMVVTGSGAQGTTTGATLPNPPPVLLIGSLLLVFLVALSVYSWKNWE